MDVAQYLTAFVGGALGWVTYKLCYGPTCYVAQVLLYRLGCWVTAMAISQPYMPARTPQAVAVEWHPESGLRALVDGHEVHTMAPATFRRVYGSSPVPATTVAVVLAQRACVDLNDEAFNDLCDRVQDVITEIHRSERSA